MSNTILEATNLSKTFADGKLYVEVLRNINLAINRGEMVAVVGTSGEGKSTLLHLLGALDAPTEGYVQICGQNITNLTPKEQGQLRNKYLGFIYQFHHLLPEFDCLENVCMPLLIRGVRPKIAKQKAESLLEKVGLTSRIKHRIGEISGGEKQRVAIARALITDPVCVLADEPTGNLDHTTAEKVYELILQLNKDLGTAFLIVTHDLSLAARMDRQLILKNSKINIGD
jgi:lipoprotein-releasing system ATP-binding protein